MYLSLRLLFCLFVFVSTGSEPLLAQTKSIAPPDSLAPPPGPTIVASDDPSSTNTSFYASKIIPASPDVASLGKYVDTPVNNYTGTPDISIPLYTIKTRDLSVPLSLNYHGSGIRVEEEASSVGLGWSLSAGGVIQHSIRGRDDFLAEGAAQVRNLNVNAEPWRTLSATAVQGSSDLCYFFENENAAWFVPKASSQLVALFEIWFATTGGQRTDLERDVFSFSFPGHSGKFVIEPLGGTQYNIRQMPQSDLRIELTNNDLSGNSGFVITDTDGTRYTFAQKEIQQSRFSSAPRETGKKYKSTAPGLNPIWGNPDTYFFPWQSFVGAWYLSEIRSVKNDVISFSYSQSADYVTALPNRTENFTTGVGNGQDRFFRWTISETKTQIVYPQSITFPNGTVTFLTDTREDLMAGARRITGLEVKATTNSLVKKMQFNQNYFNSNSGADSFVAKRLKLLSVQDITGGTCVPPYSFNYEETANLNLPNKDSYEQDYWGFYNGQLNNNTAGTTAQETSIFGTDQIGTMLPDIKIGANQQYKLSFPGADRTPNALHMRANVLASITYPTGGTAEFDFQPHVSGNLAYNPNAFPYYYIRIAPSGNFSTIGGGLRINSITTTSANGVTQTATYNYNYALSNTSSGKLMANLQFVDWIYFPAPTGPGSPSGLEQQMQYSSSPQSPMGSGAQGNCVGYSFVTVYRGATKDAEGYSTYQYRNEPDTKAADFCLDIAALYQNQCNGQSASAPPIACDPFNSTQFSTYERVSDPSVPNYINTLNGSLLQEEHYKGANTLVKQTLNEYEVVNRVRVKNFRLMKRSGIVSSFIYYSDSEWPRITSTIVNDYGGGASTTLFTSTTTSYGYNSTGAHKQITSLTTTDRSGEQVIIARTYPPDLNPATSISTGLINLNMLSAQLQESEKLIKTNAVIVPVRSTQTDYNSFGSSWMAPQTIQSQVGSGPFVTDAAFEYNTGGDVSAVTERDNIRTTFGYYSGSGKTALPQNRIVNAGQASAQQTNYNYVPLVGLSSTTDPKGMITSYSYDGYSRLTAISDFNSNLLKTFDYNYGTSGCSTKQLGLFPDLTPLIYARPTAAVGTTNLTVVVDLVELNAFPTSGLISVYFNKNVQINLTFNTTATLVGNKNVQNSAWSFDDSSNPSYYILKTNQIIPAGGILSLGLSGVLTPGATSGKLNISAIIIGESEANVTNNTDSDRIIYSQN